DDDARPPALKEDKPGRQRGRGSDGGGVVQRDGDVQASRHRPVRLPAGGAAGTVRARGEAGRGGTGLLAAGRVAAMPVALCHWSGSPPVLERPLGIAARIMRFVVKWPRVSLSLAVATAPAENGSRRKLRAVASSYPEIKHTTNPAENGDGTAAN